VLDSGRTAGFDSVTWQPELELRMAIVARSWAGKVVVAGQSLTPYEDRDQGTMIILALGWLCSVLVIAAATEHTNFSAVVRSSLRLRPVLSEPVKPRWTGRRLSHAWNGCDGVELM
jgi:hypothetical protein